MSAAVAGDAHRRREQVTRMLRDWQDRIVDALEQLDGQGRFRTFGWERPGGGGGQARVVEGGRVFERGGVNRSAVHGAAVPPSLAARHPGTDGQPFFATGLSMVLHPVNPHVPAFHANYRYFEVGRGEQSGLWWFGGGADLTPAYPREEEVAFFHRTLAGLCARHEVADHPTWKAACDDYFTVRHRGEMRGVGGIFFDQISAPGTGDFAAEVAFVEEGLATILPSYLPLVERHTGDAYGEAEKLWQRIRRGRYVEFNLVYDRGTLFGLQTAGNIEAILMSMPPEASWRFDHRPAPGTVEQRALRFFQPRDWAGSEPAALAAAIDAEIAAERKDS